MFIMHPKWSKIVENAEIARHGKVMKREKHANAVRLSRVIPGLWFPK